MERPAYRVSLALVRHDGRWLVARRPLDVHLGGLWEFPGGKCEAGESDAQAAIRELHEECGVEGRVGRVLDSIAVDYGDRIVVLTPVLCTWIAGDAQPLGSLECRWVSEDELRRLEMPEINAEIVRRALASLADDGA